MTAEFFQIPIGIPVRKAANFTYFTNKITNLILGTIFVLRKSVFGLFQTTLCRKKTYVPVISKDSNYDMMDMISC